MSKFSGMVEVPPGPDMTFDEWTFALTQVGLVTPDALRWSRGSMALPIRPPWCTTGKVVPCPAGFGNFLDSILDAPIRK
jgi:hypothetical protein